MSSSLPRPTRTHVAIALVALTTAFAVTLQLRTERETRRVLGVPSPRLAELAYTMQREEQHRTALEGEVTSLRQHLATLADAAATDQQGLRRMNDDLNAYRFLAGLTGVEGPGVVVELADNPRVLKPGENPNDLLVHYTDLARVVNDLWAAGAEAIAINGERFVATTGIECVGTTILVNQRRMTPPFRIEAIGDPRGLASEAGRPGAGLDMLRAFGFPVKIASAQRIELPPYRGSIASAIPR